MLNYLEGETKSEADLLLPEIDKLGFLKQEVDDYYDS